MPGLRDVARRAGVSLTTVSRIINYPDKPHRFSPACVRRVQETAEELGYQCNYHARSLQTGSAEVLGFVVNVSGSDNFLGRTYWGSLMGGAENAARLAGYEFTIIGPSQKTGAIDRGLQHLQQHRIDGLIVRSHGETNLGQSLLDEINGPLVLVEHGQPSAIPSIGLDGAAGVRLAVEHLLELGHRNLLWLTPCNSASRGEDPERRIEVFRRIATEAGVHHDVCRFTTSGDTTADLIRGSRAALAQRLADRRFTAIACFNDHTANGAYAALMSTGLRIPEDVSVVGFDDVSAICVYPELTTVANRSFLIGQRATTLLLEMIRDPAARKRLCGTHETIQPELVVRHSAAPPPAT